jgi:sulfur-oxidizing protein SoxX
MNKKMLMALCCGCCSAAALLGCAGLQGMSDEEAAKQAQHTMKSSFVTSGIAGLERLEQDELQSICTAYSGKPLPPELAQKIEKAQLATIKIPTFSSAKDLMGNWQQGEKIAQNGKGLTFTDKADEPGGGNCYACHRLTPDEISYGNLGPSLLNYGKLRGLGAETIEYTYKKIYNAQAFSACSNMPRFGHQKILTQAQIMDLVALLLDPQSPVNK